jgi:hypothetical protein
LTLQYSIIVISIPHDIYLIPGKGNFLPNCPTWIGVPPTSYSVDACLFAGKSRPVREAELLSPPCAKVMNKWSHSSL